jgi:primosomal protein N' (replication factor Y)
VEPRTPETAEEPRTAGTAAEPRYAEVAVPVPLRRAFTYRIPDALVPSVRPGSLVQVPFGTRVVDGFVLGLQAASPREDVKEISGVEDPELSLPETVMALCRWVSDYYLAPLGEVLRAALPAGLGKRSPESLPRAEGHPPRIVLAAEQQAALDAVTGALRSQEPASFLLYGVTGSGKTEVYLRAAQEAVAAGGKALILVPEIALSPQMVGRVEDRFGNRVALWHSALAASQRRRVWTRTRRGEIDVLVGARSAVFAPLPDLRLIVVDEEHESAYKQAESPRYHARDTALVRARMEGAVTVLGSATPSLESYANALRGKHRLLTLPRRVEGRSRSRVDLVPLPGRGGSPKPVSRILSDPLREALAGVLSRGEQCILLLNRRGHSTVIQCDPGRHVLACTQCDIALTWHSVGDHVVCHYCGRRRPRPAACPECGDPLAVFKGVGTQRAAGEITRLFGGVRVLRMDTDSMRKRGALAEALDTFRRGEADVLLGTQMVAKGLDFPRVTLVGVLNADLQLALPDFRSAERSFQLLTQVAGRSGRGDHPGRVIFQTDHADHYAVTAAAEQDADRFFREEMAARQDPAYPPHVRLVNLMFDGRGEDRVVREAEAAAAFLAARIRAGGSGVELLGPAPQPFSRLKGRHRWHITLRGRDHRTLRDLAAAALDRPDAAPSRSVRAAVDVDPVSLL